ncbi:MAG: glycosyltransferase family 9 protein [Rhodospirillales bacterium]
MPESPRRLECPKGDKPLSIIHKITENIITGMAAKARTDKHGLLLVSSGGLGDTILFSLMIERFMALVPEDEPVWLVVRAESRLASFLFPDRVRMMPVDYRKFIRASAYRVAVCRQIRDFGVRTAISTDHLRLPTVDDLMIMASGATERFALSPRSWPKHDAALQKHRAWYSRWVEPDPAMAHRLIRWWELANALTGEAPPPPVVRFDPDRLPGAVTGPRPHIVLHPFSAIAEREAAPEVFIALVEAFRDTHDIILSAGPGDLARAPQHHGLAALDGVRVDESELASKAALIRAAALVVSVDTSIMHLAAGAGAPTLCLASAAHIVDSVPYDSRMMPENIRFDVPNIDCAGCLGQCIHPLENGRYHCLTQITPDRALNAAREVLAQHAGPA